MTLIMWHMYCASPSDAVKDGKLSNKIVYYTILMAAQATLIAREETWLRYICSR
jgi:hypothetical protein